MSDTIDSTMDSPAQTNANVYPPSGQATIDAPAFNKSGTQLNLEAKSVKNAQQAWEICKGLEYNNRLRAMRTADIQALHDGQPPKSACDQQQKAKSCEANASTLWLAGIVARVSQRFVNAIISQTYVTASALPSTFENAKWKTDLLRAKFTELVRGWDGNTGFINAISVETVLQGYGYAMFLDPYTCFPSFFKQEDCLLPEKATQHARDLQFFAARRDFRLDQFLELFADEKAAEEMGYNLKNCMAAANRAAMQDLTEDATTTQFRRFADMIDEGSIGIAVSSTGERVVKTWMLFNREYDGQVSFWLLERETGKLLRFAFKLFPRMHDTLAIYSFEAGNGCIHSSKGLGRKLAALSIMKELFRCGIIDNSRISGLMVVRADAKDKTKFQPTVTAPFIILDKSIDISEKQFQASAEAYKVVDLLIDSWAEQAVGAYLAAQISEKGTAEKTATEASIDARRENEAADIMIRRIIDQDANRTQIMQLRACSKDNLADARRIYAKIIDNPDEEPEKFFPKDVDDAAVMRFLVAAMEAGLTDNEIIVWSRSAASPFAHVTEGAVQRGVTMASAKYAGNPNIDQNELVYFDLEGMVGAEMAKKLFIPKANETLAIEAGRKQQQESILMAISGEMIPVSPRDNHPIEAAVVVETLSRTIAPQLSNANAPDAILKVAELNLNHLGEHLKAAQAQGMDKLPAIKEANKFYEGFKKQLMEVVELREQAKVAQAVVTQQVRGELAVQDAANQVAATVPEAPATEVPAEEAIPAESPPGAFEPEPPLPTARGVPTLTPG